MVRQDENVFVKTNKPTKKNCYKTALKSSLGGK